MESRINKVLPQVYLLFVISSTFSIALAQISLGLCSLLFIYLFFSYDIKVNHAPIKYLYYSVLGYILWLVISSLFGSSPVESIMIIKEEWLFLALPIGIYLLRDENFRKKLVYVFALATLIVSVYGLIQLFTGYNLYKETLPINEYGNAYQIYGMFSHRLTFGNYFGTVSMFLFGIYVVSSPALGKNIRLTIFWGAVLAMVATVLTLSRGPIASLGVVLIMSGFLMHKKFHLYSIPLLVLLIVLVFSFVPDFSEKFTKKLYADTSTEYEGSRRFIWSNSIKIIKENLFLGVGQGNFRKEYVKHLRADIHEERKHSHAHNDFLNISAISGIPGGVIFLLIWIFLFIALFKKWKVLKNRNDLDSGILSGAILASLFFLLSSMTEATFADEEVRQMLMFIWASGLALVVYEGKYNRAEIT